MKYKKIIMFIAATFIMSNNISYIAMGSVNNNINKGAINIEDEKQDHRVINKNNLRIKEKNDVINLNENINNIKNLDEGTIIVRFKSNKEGLQSLFSVSNDRVKHGYLSLYIKQDTVGFELKTQSQEGNTDAGTINLQHQYAGVKLNEGFNTIALKVDKSYGYKLFINGELLKDIKDNNVHFLKDIENSNSIAIGGLDRYSAKGSWLFNGDIDFVNVNTKVLSDEYLLKKTGETQKIDKEETLPEGVIKTDPINLFYSGYLGSKNYRIPSLLTTKEGTILSSIDARINGGGDAPNNIDTAIRRSTDGGKTWEDGKIILDYPGEASAIDTSMIQDKTTGRIYLMVTHFPTGYGFWQSKSGTGYKEINNKKYMILTDSHGKEYTIREEGKVYDDNNSLTNYTVDEDKNLYNKEEKIDNILTKSSPLKVYGTSYLHLIYSDDDGKTWSKPRDLNTEVKNDWMKFLGTAPGRGIQIENGEHKGRLVFPVYYTNKYEKQSSAVVYSDDYGETWNMGESPNDGRIIRNGNSITSESLNEQQYELTECQVVEMPNGQLKLFMRNRGNDKRVAIATSFDGGATWDENVEQEHVLLEPYCQLSVINYKDKIDGKDALIFSNPSAGTRINGTVQVGLINENGTYDNGQPKYEIQWPYKKSIKDGFYGYSCLTQLPNGNIGVLYETTDDTDMAYTEMNLEYLKYNPNEHMTAEPEVISGSFDKKKYFEGENLLLKLTFNQVVSIIGSRELIVNIGTSSIKMNMIEWEDAKEVLFKGTIPKGIKGDFNVKVEPNNAMEIFDIYGRSITLKEDVNSKIEGNINIDTNTP